MPRSHTTPGWTGGAVSGATPSAAKEEGVDGTASAPALTAALSDAASIGTALSSKK
ncbi:hypothetical protein ID850_19865, partial [Xenorhabdus sp. Flor]|nr:hypothetical protein [Xenorhabdus sp. Flor]